jgi:IS1 family transposase
VGDCWISLILAKDSGLILSARVGKHTDELIEELVASTEGKTDCQFWDTERWGGRKRVLPSEAQHYISKERTQRLERTNGILRYSNRKMASSAEQIRQGVAADQGHDSLGGQLLQLDVGTQSLW